MAPDRVIGLVLPLVGLMSGRATVGRATVNRGKISPPCPQRAFSSLNNVRGITGATSIPIERGKVNKNSSRPAYTILKISVTEEHETNLNLYLQQKGK